MIKKCLGCGITLQDQNEQKLGFVKDLSMDYCMRCFRLKHYHEIGKIKFSLTNEEIIQEVNQNTGFVFFVVDVLNMYSESISLYKKITLPKMFVISKIDLLPRSISLSKIKNWLRKTFDIKEDILFIQNKSTSAKKIMQIIAEKKEKNFYFLGLTNAGKSTLLNNILKEVETNHKEITVSEIPNTTLDFIKIPLPNKKTILDSVGFTYPYAFEETNLIQKSVIKREIKPRTFDLKQEAILSLEDKVYVKMAERNSLTWYGSDHLSLKRIYVEPKEEAFSIKVSKETNLHIKGVGFFYIKNAGTVLLWGINKENVTTIPSFLGSGNYE